MSRRDRHELKPKKVPFMMEGSFMARPLPMLESPAFRVLSFAGHRFLIRLEIEHLHHGRKENGRLIVTYGQFAEWIHRNSVAPAQRECVALGFVEITEHGRGGPFKRPNRYRLTYDTHVGANGQPVAATNEWRTIQTLEQAEAIAEKARSGGTNTVTPRKQKAGPKNRTSRHTITVTPPPPSPDTITVTPPHFPRHNYCDSYLYLQGDGDDEGGPAGGPPPASARFSAQRPRAAEPSPSAREARKEPAPAPPREGTAEPATVPKTATAYVAYAKAWMAGTTNADDVTPGRALGRWDLERRMRNRLHPLLGGADLKALREVRNARRTALTGK